MLLLFFAARRWRSALPTLAALLAAADAVRAQPRPDVTAQAKVSQRERAIELTRRAAAEFQNRRYASTVKLCRQAIATDAKYVRAYTWLGASQQKLGQLSSARQAFARVVALAPGSSDAARARRGLREVSREQSRLAASSRRNSNLTATATTTLFRLAWSARAHEGGVRTLAWRPDGALLASGGSDKKVRWWRALDGRGVGEVGGYREDVIALAWSPDGSALAVGSFDNRLDIVRASFDSQAGSVSASIERSLDSGGFDVNALAWSSAPGQSALLAAGLGDGTIRIWSTPLNSSGSSSGSTWPMQRVLRGHSAGVTQVAFAGGALISAALDSSARAWDLGTGASLWVAAREGSPSISVAPDGAKVAIATGSLVQWREVKADRLLRSQAAPRASLAQAAWSPDGSLLAIGSYTAQVRLWDARGVLVGRLNTLSPASRALAWSPDSRALAVAGADGWLRVWRRAST